LFIDVESGKVVNVAVIGLGEMGGAVSSNLAAAGHAVAVFDLQQALVDEAVTDGSLAAASVSDAVRGAEMVHVVVFTDAQARAVVLGHDSEPGALAVMEDGSALVIHSTVAPATCREMAEQAAVHGIDVIDAGMTGTGAAARAGTITLLVGGADDVVARCRDELSCFAQVVMHVGPVGTGMVAKIVNNLSVLVNAEATRQLVQFGEATGLGEQALLEVLNAGTGRSWASENWALIRPVVESPADGSPYPAMARKDCDLALTVAAAAGTSAPIAEAIAERLAELDRAGGIGSQP
jgi:3-hydroxyisobutyrate dehydrogenase